MSVKSKIQTVVEFLTNKKCEKCKHNKGLICDSPKGKKCVSSIFPIGLRRKRKAVNVMIEKYDFSNMFLNVEIKPIPNLQVERKNCYDCIHCGACSDAGDSGFSSLMEDASGCKHFKNKENFAEVVRCKGCKRRGCDKCPMYHEELRDYDDYGYKSVDVVATDNTIDDGFCHFGERIESEVET